MRNIKILMLGVIALTIVSCGVNPELRLASESGCELITSFNVYMRDVNNGVNFGLLKSAFKNWEVDAKGIEIEAISNQMESICSRYTQKQLEEVLVTLSSIDFSYSDKH